MISYLNLIKDIDDEIQALSQQAGGPPCPMDCFECCRNTATMAISLAEAQHLAIGLKKLPAQLRKFILKKAECSINTVEQEGYSEEIILSTGVEVAKAIKGQIGGECPMLVGGVCTVYDHRPIICRVWGYPINNGHNSSEIVCCKKTFINSKKRYQALPYSKYWNESKQLSTILNTKDYKNSNSRTPNCYLVRRLLNDSV